jgi:hypothetical protein
MLFLSKDLAMTALGDCITYIDIRPPVSAKEFRE